MPDPGYGPNGEWLAPVGLVSWEANQPPTPMTTGDDIWFIYPLGVLTLPLIDQNDDEVWANVYLGGL